MRIFITVIAFVFSLQVFGQYLVNLELITSDLNSPVAIENAGDERLFVVERSGYIRLIDGSGVLQNTPFLDIDNRVIFTSGFSEQGLLGLAFHPDYVNNGHFFVHYIRLNGDSRISRFTVSDNDPDQANPDSELTILDMAQPYSNHNGGDLKFGPDGMLYIGMGDGGSGGDPLNNGQDRESLLGKMLRIDVNNSTEAVPYVIPADNPFVGDATTLNEIWALGLRNPWRYSFDRGTGDLYIADVGQDDWAEVDYEAWPSAGGRNYGWRCYEANDTYNTGNCLDMSAYDFPVHAYAHGFSGPCSITGGFVYRGCEYSDLYGKYIYADFCDGSIWALQKDDMDNWTNETANDNNAGRWTSFGEGADGSLYACNLDGSLYEVKGDESFQFNFFLGEDVIMLDGAELPDIASIQWYLNGEAIPGATYTSLTLTQTGDYYVEVTTTGGCLLISDEMNIIPSNTIQLAGISELSVFPNPFNSTFQLDIKPEKSQLLEIQLLDARGQLLWRSEWRVNGDASKEINIGSLHSGQYFLLIKNEEGHTIRKVTKQ